jgi:hypothetical protein
MMVDCAMSARFRLGLMPARAFAAIDSDGLLPARP